MFSRRAVATTKRLVRNFSKTTFRQPDPSKKRLVLAYSGGLDTSCQLKYLTKELDYEVCAYIADLGQSDITSPEKKKEIAEKARLSGAYSFYCEDLKNDFLTDFVFPMLKSSCLYEGRYLLGTSIARPCIGKRQVEIAKEEGCGYISHGSTGKGNDQVRFELCYKSLSPDLVPVTLWREKEYCAKFEGRSALLDYAEKNGIPVSQTKKFSYSEDENCLHISFESGELEDPGYPGNSPTPSIYPGQVLKKTIVDLKKTPDEEEILKIDFKSGVPTKVENLTTKEVESDPVGLFDLLNKTAGKHGVGRLDIVENRFVGMKSRGCYETPAGTVLHKAHQDLETLTLDREVMRVKDGLMPKYADLVYNGYWFSPEMEYLKEVVDISQRNVTGSVYVQLYKGGAYVVGRESEKHSLYNQKLVSMDVHGGYDPSQATGFINTLATRLIASAEQAKRLK